MAGYKNQNDLLLVLDALQSILSEESKYFLQTPTPSNLFIPPKGQVSKFRNNPEFDLCTEIGKFVDSSSPDSYSLLVLGDSGTGKTSLALHLCSEYLERYKSKTSSWFPIYLNLPKICQGQEQYSCLLESFIQAHSDRFCVSTRGMSHALIKATITLKLNILFLLDSYDGLGEWPNLWAANSWRNKQNRVKTVFFSRADAFPSLKDRKVSMKFDREVSPGEYPSLEYTILRFDFTQISDYIEKFVGYLSDLKMNENILMDPKTVNAHFWLKIIRDTAGTDWIKDSNKYVSYVTTKFPELKELAVTPFILFLILQILPGVAKAAESRFPDNVKRNYCFTEYQVYEEFTKQWFAYQAEIVKSSKRPLDLFELNSQSEPGHNIIEEYFQVYAQNLAVYLVEKTGGLKLLDGLTEEETLKPTLPIPDSLEFQSKFSKLPDSRLFLEKENLVALRRGCLLAVDTESGNVQKYYFLHQSLVEFFASKQVFLDLRTEFDYYVNFAYPIHEILKEQENFNFEICSFNNAPINKFPVQVIKFLANKLKEDSAFASLLEEIIVKSAEIKQLRQMASNSITLLNFAGISISGRNFRHVHIPGANLRNSILQGTDFSFANLANVNLERACLTNVDFRGCNLFGASFGYPSILNSPRNSNSQRNSMFTIKPNDSESTYLCTSYSESNNFFVNDLNQIETNFNSEGQFQSDVNPYGIEDFVPEPVNSNIVCFGGSWGLKDVYFWNLNSRSFVDSLEIPNLGDYVDKNCGKNWLSLESDLCTEFTCASMGDLPHIYGISHLAYNLPSHNILVAFLDFTDSGFGLEIFPNSSVALTVNLQIQTRILGKTQNSSLQSIGCRNTDLKFNDGGNGTGLISVLTRGKVVIYKISGTDNVVPLATLPRSKIVSSKFSSNNKYFVYSDATNTKSGFTLVEFDYEGHEHSLVEAGKKLGLASDLIMFDFNPSSTLLATGIETWFVMPIEIWNLGCLDTPLHIISKLKIKNSMSPLFCFTNDTLIAYHSGPNQISLTKLEDKTNFYHESMLGKSRGTPDQKLYQPSVLSNQFHHMGTWKKNCFEIMNLRTRGNVSVTVVGRKEDICQLLIDDTSLLVLVLVSGPGKTDCKVRLYEIGSAECIVERELSGQHVRSIVGSDNVLLALFVTRNNTRAHVLYKLSIESKTIKIVPSKLIQIGQGAGSTPFDHNGNWFMLPVSDFVAEDAKKNRKACYNISICKISTGKEDLFEPSFGLCLEPFHGTKSTGHCDFVSSNSGDRCKFFVFSASHLEAYEFQMGGNDVPTPVVNSYIAKEFSVQKQWICYLLDVPEIGCFLAAGRTGYYICVIDSSTLEELFVIRLWFLLATIEYKYDSEAQPNLIFAACNTQNVIKFTICKEARSWSWSILWSLDPCPSFLAANSNFEKSFDLAPSCQQLIKEAEGKFGSIICTNRDTRKYISLGDLTRGLVDATEKGIGVKPIFNGRKGHLVNCVIDSNSWTVSVFAMKGKYKLPFGLYLDKSNHITLVVEGMRGGWRFICRADFTYVSPGEGHAKQVVIETTRMTSGKEMRDLVKTSNCRTHNITSSDGVFLLESIMEDRTKTLEFTQFSKNCVDWCREKLKLVGIDYETPIYYAGLSLPGVLLNS